MKLIGFAAGLAVACSVAIGAASPQTESKSKVTVKDGTDVTVTGCIEPTASGKGYMLTHVADKKGTMHDYMLAASEEDYSKHVGHRVTIEGKVADQGDGKVKVETRTKTKIENGNDKETHSKSEMHGDMDGMRFLGVKSLKMIAGTCP
jgi:azurin